jgi:hypothetical protein
MSILGLLGLFIMRLFKKEEMGLANSSSSFSAITR